MPRIPRPTTLVLLGLLALLLAAPAADAAGETKKFPEHNFELTPPNEAWQWVDLNDGMKDAGFVARLGRRAAGTTVIVDIRVAPTGDLPLDELTKEVTQALSGQLTSVQGTRAEKGKLSGLDGTLVTIKGENSSGAKVLFRVYSIAAGGKFHQMLIQFVDGAEDHLARETDNLRRGYRLLEGAGPEEEPLGATDSVDDIPDMGGDGQGGGGGADIPDGAGLQKEGRTLHFKNYNLKWTLPEDSPFQWDEVNPAEKIPDDRVVMAASLVASVDRKAARDGEPTSNRAVVLLLLEKPQGFPNAIVESPNFQTFAAENFFDDVEYGRLSVETDRQIGDTEGASLFMAGRKEEDVVYARFYFVRLKSLLYQFRVFMRGGREADQVFARDVDKLMAGISFPDQVEAVIGPMGIEAVMASNESRGKDVGEETEITSVGFRAEKPDFMGAVTYDPRALPNMRLAWETRTEDRQKYLYFDVQSFPYDPGAGSPDDQLTAKIEQREGLWRQVVQSAQTVAKGDEPFFKDRFSRGKGFGYEFEGTFNDTPYKEMGWVVRYKDYIYWVRIQVGGKDAEDAFKKEIRKLERCLKF